MQGLRVINVLPYRERSFILFERDQRNGFTLETRQTNMRKKKLLILGAVILTSSFGGILASILHATIGAVILLGLIRIVKRA